ncbi:hypothetical protein [Nocardioides conyzicola]|uniref:hypothetical protein n=1 Tax=Nocardioides conyzicola TaxID=1651781 RepID=UPI0031F08347
MTVDGVDFSVAYDVSQPGAYHYTVAATAGGGPALKYGFTSRRSDYGKSTTAEHIEAIRTFLSAVDPVTGYIEDDQSEDDSWS